MKRIVSLTLAALLAASAVSCAAPSPAQTVTSSDISASVAFLNDRVADTSDIILGDADTAASLGIDMTDFEDSGYTIRTIGTQTAILGKTADGVDRAVRDYVKHQSDPTYTVTVGEGYRIKHLTVCGNDIADYVIVLPADKGEFPECVEYAASELRDLIKQVCGAELEITSAAPADGKGFFLIPDADESLGDDGFDVSVHGGKVTLCGGHIRGCLYAVYDIAEDVLGYRFLTAWETYVYASDHVDLADGYESREVPSFAGRGVNDGSVSYTEVLSSMKVTEFCARRRNLANSANVAKTGYVPGFTCGHDIASLSETSREFQPCSFDEGILETVTENVMKKLDAADKAGELGRSVKHVSIGQNDNNQFCKCKQCREQEKKTGSRAGCSLYFANLVAEAVCGVYPDVGISIFAYWGAVIPPKGMTAHPNVIVCYVTYGYCGVHPISGAECDPDYHFQENLNNLVHADYIAEWSKICGKVQIWQYESNYWCGLLPLFNADDYTDDFSYFADCGVNGIFCDFAESQMSFDELFVYLASLLSWDAHMSEEEYDLKMREFMELYYGDGWELLYGYVIAACRVRDSKECGSGEPFDWYAENYEYLVSLFDDAASLANTAAQQRRIERTSLHVRYMALCGMYDDRYVNGTDSDRAFLQSIADHIRDGLFEYNFMYWGTTVSEPGDKRVFDTDFDLSHLDPKNWC